MARAVRASEFKDIHQREICTAFYKLADRHGRSRVWHDFVTMAACSIGQIDMSKRHERIEMYTSTARRYTEPELVTFAEMLHEVIQGLDDCSDQDFLGDLFMHLNLGNEYNGQFFTPYKVCAMMARIAAPDMVSEVAERGYTSVNDPACGAGALLIPYANEARRQGVNFQQNIMFVAQDIDFTAAMMCYIQLSLLGCPGYVIVGNTLTTPPTTPLEDQHVWRTPLFFALIWRHREFIERVKELTSNPALQTKSKTQRTETYEQMSLF